MEATTKEATTGSLRHWVRKCAEPVLLWLAAVVIAGGGVLIWTRVVLSSASGIGGEPATVVSAISLQVALLAVFFLVVTFGIAVFGFLGYRKIHDTATEDARREARKVATDTAHRILATTKPVASPKPVPEQETRKDMDA